MVILSNKLKSLKLKLKHWNRTIFGDVNSNVKLAMQQLDVIQKQIDEEGYSDSLMDHEKAA